VGTPYFICPEIYLKKPYSSTSDIWSLGGVLYNLAALHPPFLADKCVCLSVCLWCWRCTGFYPSGFD